MISFIDQALKSGARRWRRFLLADIGRVLQELTQTQAAVLNKLALPREPVGVGSHGGSSLDINLLLHESRSGLLRGMPPGARTMLSAGCSGSWYFEWIERCYGRVEQHIGIEFYVPKPTELPENVIWIANTVADMSDVDNVSCDLLFSGQNVEHLWPEEVAGFLLEAARVTRPGGHLVIDSPNRNLTGALNWSHPEHTIELTVTEIKRLVTLAGFDITKVCGIWLSRDPHSGRLLPFDPNQHDEIWSLAERLICGLHQPEQAFIWWIEARRSSRQAERDALADEMKQIFNAAWPERLNRMVVGIGRIEERPDGRWIVSESGQSGVLVYGPYAPLRAGRYTVTFSVSCAGAEEGATVAMCDVMAASSEEKPLVATAVKAQQLQQTGTVQLSFNLSSMTFGVQFRCQSTGVGSLACAKLVSLFSDSEGKVVNPMA